MLNFLKSCNSFFTSYYELGYKRAIKKEQEEIEDFFMILAFSEMMGIPNPYEFYTLEIIPSLIPRFHQWHKKAGFEKSPFDYFPCMCC